MEIPNKRGLIMKYSIVSPAYGRDYPSGEKAIRDFKDGKDFMCESLDLGGYTYCSIRDFLDGHHIEIRYSNMMKQTLYTVGS